MRRIVMLVMVALVMAAMLLAMAMPAFAAASENASCAGESRSTFNGRELGESISEFSKANQGIGQEQSPNVKTNCGER